MGDLRKQLAGYFKREYNFDGVPTVAELANLRPVNEFPLPEICRPYVCEFCLRTGSRVGPEVTYVTQRERYAHLLRHMLLEMPGTEPSQGLVLELEGRAFPRLARPDGDASSEEKKEEKEEKEEEVKDELMEAPLPLTLAETKKKEEKEPSEEEPPTAVTEKLTGPSGSEKVVETTSVTERPAETTKVVERPPKSTPGREKPAEVTSSESVKEQMSPTESDSVMEQTSPTESESSTELTSPTTFTLLQPSPSTSSAFARKSIPSPRSLTKTSAAALIRKKAVTACRSRPDITAFPILTEADALAALETFSKEEPRSRRSASIEQVPKQKTFKAKKTVKEKTAKMAKKPASAGCAPVTPPPTVNRTPSDTPGSSGKRKRLSDNRQTRLSDDEETSPDRARLEAMAVWRPFESASSSEEAVGWPRRCRSCHISVPNASAVPAHVFTRHIRRPSVHCPACSYSVFYHLHQIEDHMAAEHPGSVEEPRDMRPNAADELEDWVLRCGLR